MLSFELVNFEIEILEVLLIKFQVLQFILI